MIKLTLCYDVEGWAWHRRALDLIEFAPPGYQITAVSQQTFYKQQLRRLSQPLMFFSWIECPGDIANRTVTLLANPCVKYDNWKNRNPDDNAWISVGATRNRNQKNAKARLKRFKRVICLTPELENIARTFGARAECIPTGIHHIAFQPRKPLSTSGKLRVGWCGQLKQDDPYNQKGYKWVAEPVMTRCKDFCEFQVNTRDYRTALSREEMCAWYNNIDVFLCTSIHEGTPTTAMEAMMCGRPTVTTSVGDMPNIINGTNGVLVGSYTDAESAEIVIERLCNALHSYYADRDKLHAAGAAARTIMLETRNWETLAAKWLNAICK